MKGSGTRDVFESLPGGVYDPVDAVVEWESLFAGVGSQALIQAGEPQVITEIANDGMYVFVVSTRLLTFLATADRGRLDEVARSWAMLRQADGEDIGADAAVDHLRDLAVLARKATDRGVRLYCSVT